MWQGFAAAAGNMLGSLLPFTKFGYKHSPQKRAFDASVRQEQRIFERDSAYNAPSAQMARFKEANLNPNLMYGQGNPGNVTGNAVGMQAPEAPRMDAVSNIAQSLLLGKEMELKDANIAYINQNTKLLSEKTGSEAWKQQLMEQNWNWLEKNYPEVLKRMQRENRIGDETEEAQKAKTLLGVEGLDITNDLLREDLEQRHRENRIGRAAEPFDLQKRQGQGILAMHKIQTELLKQGLMEKDGSIKKEVLTGKQFSNAILDMQKRFVTTGEMNATQYFQMLIMLLASAIR